VDAQRLAQERGQWKKNSYSSGLQAITRKEMSMALAHDARGSENEGREQAMPEEPKPERPRAGGFVGRGSQPPPHQLGAWNNCCHPFSHRAITLENGRILDRFQTAVLI